MVSVTRPLTGFFTTVVANDDLVRDELISAADADAFVERTVKAATAAGYALDPDDVRARLQDPAQRDRLAQWLASEGPTPPWLGKRS